jgi:hypothetical protein
MIKNIRFVGEKNNLDNTKIRIAYFCVVQIKELIINKLDIFSFNELRIFIS